MKLFILAAFALTVSASACFAKPAPAKPPRETASAAKTASNSPKAGTTIGHDGQDAAQRCSTENPNIEYRDCVNASTRDANAKVRLA
jgi:hypothetical protein